MIYKYSCKNFYSIKEKVEVRFDVNRKTPFSDAYVDQPYGRVSLVGAVIGPNAAGKTNVIKALAFIRYLITQSPSDDPLPFEVFADGRQQATEFSVEFSVDSRYFIYDFKVNSEQILSETIREKSLSIRRTTSKVLFHRNWDPEKKDYSVSSKEFQLPSGVYVRKGSSIIASMELAGDKEHISTKIFNYWEDSVVANVGEDGNSEETHYHIDEMAVAAIEFFYDKENMKVDAMDVLRKLDIDFHDFERQKLQIKDRFHYSIRHRLGKDRKFSIPIEHESSGTKKAILMLMYIIQVLKQPGGIAAIDELDAYLHPDIVEALVKIFMSPETNPNRAQLLFSSHSHQLLAEFDKQQIILVEKNDEGATDVWRLDDVSGVRADDNYYAKYIAGAYAAKPKIG